MLKQVSVIGGFVGLMLLFSQSGWAEEAPNKHRIVQGTIVDKAGSPAVKVPDGTVYQLNENRALRHGHKMPKEGEEVTVTIDRKTNAVLEIHPKGTKTSHRFITGDVVSIGLRQGTITLKTPEGQQSFPLEKREMSASVRDGATVEAEINEVGSVIDVQPLEHRQLDPNEKSTPINRSH